MELKEQLLFIACGKAKGWQEE